jgi:predicted ABC-type ATPase
MTPRHMIVEFQKAGFFVILLFVGLTSSELSILRVQTRQKQGGHGVPRTKLLERFPRTQQAIRHAATIADRTIMFDNSRGLSKAFSLVRVQKGKEVLYDCRRDSAESQLRSVATYWLNRVAPEY